MELLIKSDGQDVSVKMNNFIPKAVNVALARILEAMAKEQSKDPMELKIAYLCALAVEFGIGIEIAGVNDDD